MNYYKRHLGDYAKDTRHLSLAEHGAFCLLLDYYYATEKPIPDDRCERIANAYAVSEREAVRAVLGEFFVQTPEGWVNRRADTVIAEYNAKSLKAKESAEARWGKSHSERNANASKKECEGNASHKPLATSHKEDKKPAPRRASSKVDLQTFLAECEADGELPIPADDPIYDYAESIGLPDGYLALAWGWFKVSRASAKQAGKNGWRAHFRDAVRGNWPKMWYAAKEGGWALTTVGEQARLAAA